MAYTTPTNMAQAFGLEELVQMLADEERLLTAQLLKDAIAGTWTGTPTAEEQAAAQAALARLVKTIGNNSNLMDGYLRAKLQLPLSPADANAGTLEDCCNALVRYALRDDAENMTDLVDARRKHWMAWLRDVADGRTLLAGAGGQAVPMAGGVKTGQPKSAYPWHAFGGVR